jgi:diguanylate cyclase (GGDEF)-like protein/PAS domain S-box-containing protein
MKDSKEALREEFDGLQERARKLSAEKAEYQLLVHLVENLTKISAGEETISRKLQCILETIGGSNITLCYKTDRGYRCLDALGNNTYLDQLNEANTEEAFKTCRFVEVVEDFSKTLMQTPEFSRAYTWYFPIESGSNTALGVIKIEGTYIGSPEMRKQILSFFRYAAVILKNEILGLSKLKSSQVKLREEIEERKQIEQNLFLEKEQLRITFQSIGDGVITTDTQAKITTLNDVAEELTGWSTAEAEGKLLKEVFITTNLISGKPAENLAEAVITTEDIYNKGNYVLLTSRRGKERYIMESAAPFRDIKGAIVGAVIIFRDVTENKILNEALRESERSRAVLLSNFPGLAYRCKNDYHWTMELVSEGCYDLTGYCPEDLIDNQRVSFNDLILPDDREHVCFKWAQAVANMTRFREEYRIITASGEVKWVSEQGEAVNDKSGNVIALEGFITDITDRKIREEEIIFISYHDKLTGLYNRRYFEEELRRLDTERNLPLTVVMADVNGLKIINDAFGHQAGDSLLQKVAETIKNHCRSDDILARIGGDEFVLLLPKTKAAAAKQLIDRISKQILSNNMMGLEASVSFGIDTKSTASTLINEVLRNAEDYMYRNKLHESTSKTSTVIKSILNTLHVKSPREEAHSRRVSLLCEKIAFAMGLSFEEVKKMRLAGELHDIGKIAVDTAILDKEGELTKTERTEIRRHPETGFRLLGTSREFYSIAEYVLAHHERWDGKGYPKGLSKEAIPWEARVIAIADAYDAMTSHRPYRRAMTRKQALAEISKNAGKQFDPEIARIFIKKVLE